MRATALEVTETAALVELRPCWLARLFGARTVVVTLDREYPRGWRTRFSDEPLSHVRNGALLRRALDFRPVAKLPRATVTRCPHGFESPRREGRLSCVRCIP